MKIWKVWGEYEDDGVNIITKRITAKTAVDALYDFYEIMEEQYPEKWETMGRSNVFITDYKQEDDNQ